MAKPASADAQALLAEIAERPGDDTPRLVYADWLDEHGCEPEDHDRAEFIRLQCRTAELSSVGVDWFPVSDPDQRVDALLKKHRKRWLEALPKWARANGNRFDRGFPAHVHLSGNVEELLQLAEKWKEVPLFTVEMQFESADVYDEHYSVTIRRELRQLAQTPALSRVTDINFWEQGVDDVALAALVASPYLQNLRQLGLYTNNVTTPGFRALGASPNLGNLSILEMGNNFIKPAGIEAVVSSPNLPNLATLDLGDGNFGLDVVRRLAKCLTLPSLRQLSLGSNALGDEGVHILARSPSLARLGCF
jgi:uncharacterized protein (TIGR02996 family)